MPTKRRKSHTGVAYGAVDSPDANANPRGRRSPTMAVRWLFSCGYKTGTLRPVRGGWMNGDCFDRKSGEPRGPRWIRPKNGGGYEVVSVEPTS